MSNIREEILFDTVLLDEMGSQNSTIKVLEFYLDESPKYLLDFEKLMFERDISGIIEKAHKLKSSLGMLKAELLVSLLNQVEVAAKELNFDKLQELFDSGWWFAYGSSVLVSSVILIWISVTVSIFTVF